MYFIFGYVDVIHIASIDDHFSCGVMPEVKDI